MEDGQDNLGLVALVGDGAGEREKDLEHSLLLEDDLIGKDKESCETNTELLLKLGVKDEESWEFKRTELGTTSWKIENTDYIR